MVNPVLSNLQRTISNQNLKIAEDALGFVNGRAGVGNAGGVWDSLIEIRSQH
jgi:hypothetical protein